MGSGQGGAVGSQTEQGKAALHRAAMEEAALADVSLPGGVTLAGTEGASVHGVGEGAPSSILVKYSLETLWSISGLGSVLVMPCDYKGRQIPSEG